MLKAAVFPSKYIQGDGVLANIADIIKQLGCKHPIIMWGKRTKKATEGIVPARFEGSRHGSLRADAPRRVHPRRPATRSRRK